MVYCEDSSRIQLNKLSDRQPSMGNSKFQCLFIAVPLKNDIMRLAHDSTMIPYRYLVMVVIH